MNLWQLHCISDDDPGPLGRYDTVSLSRLTACKFQFDAAGPAPFLSDRMTTMRRPRMRVSKCENTPMRNTVSALNPWSHLQCQSFNSDHNFSVRFIDLEDRERGLKIVNALLRYRKGLEQINCWLAKGDVSKEEAAEVMHIFKSQWLSENRGAIEVNSH
jgi:hypothetical protein